MSKVTKHIETKEGLEELLRRYKEANAPKEWIMTIESCIKEELAMDETDYDLSPKELRPLWKGLK